MQLGVYLVTDRRLCGDRGVFETVRAAVDAGAHSVQYRDKLASSEEQLRDVERLAEIIDGRALFLVNDSLDVAVEARRRAFRVDGVHLGQGDADPVEARERLGGDALVGLTANTPAHVATLNRLPPGTVDYLGVGVIRPTSTKPDHPPALGIEGFADFVAAISLPAVAIGGVRVSDVADLRRAGAAGVAVVSAICAAPDVGEATQRFVEAWA
ncbi:thiamine phosphate synthase [uncultured Tessaracoccus sp.]|uniref:thiamine phosphate synthase n=1 Tax=uncultured Tessaracoccus sp. TaxID=905023 RepID=UPI0025DFC401|nr:thiamine phosphate synthase [uncultured Tessaracoccus sp.]